MTKRRVVPIANQLRAMRATMGLTQSRMAQELRISLRTYHGWENGASEPQASTWEQIKLLMVTLKAS